MSELSRSTAAPTDDELHARFRPIFEKIAAGAVDRERNRTLAVEEAGWLRDAGFGALRVPVGFGGSGASLSQLFALLVELAAADSNLPQALRTHFSFVEERLAGLVDTDPAVTNRWLATVGSGKLLGNATTERADSPRNSTTTLLTRHGSELRLNGTKYYSTGSLYADLIDVVALDPDGVRVAAVVPADAPGIERLDDYTGFGQRLSASGTTHFTDVVVDPADVRLAPADTPRSFRQGFLQLVQLAGLAGIARRAVDDVADYVRDRRRSWAYGNADLPREDPLVQQVVGRVEGAAFAAAATVAAAAASMERAAADPRDADLASAAELDVYRAQSTVPDLVLGATAELFEVGGASSTDDGLALDRHWRNARTLAVHNPVVYKQRVVGDHVLNGTRPVLSLTVGRADLPGAS